MAAHRQPTPPYPSTSRPATPDMGARKPTYEEPNARIRTLAAMYTKQADKKDAPSGHTFLPALRLIVFGTTITRC